ncbi:hypothetical protein ZHAS_00021266 [Anopheles sinensis]|uniref:Secreted protein n=1 Tax=Anopheles sinensis TaxID=74873 RepID=A0A084WRY2_ANOSI|nr:hypothetical protein ZHAS_00021266 [Anopheles sinensis]
MGKIAPISRGLIVVVRGCLLLLLTKGPKPAEHNPQRLTSVAVWSLNRSSRRVAGGNGALVQVTECGKE